MTHYRAYLLDEANHIVWVADVDAINDATAWLSARRTFALPAMIELWAGERCVPLTAP